MLISALAFYAATQAAAPHSRDDLVHLIFGIEANATFNIYRGGNSILQDVPSSPGGTLQFTDNAEAGLYNIFNTREEWNSGQNDGEPAGNTNELRLVHPNPTSGVVRVEYSLREETSIEICWTDVAGRMVGPRMTRCGVAGTGTWETDLRKLGGPALAAGVYFLRVRLGTTRHSKRVVLLPRN